MNAPIRRFDVIVIGGGPAGSTAARALRLAGRRVAVLDRQRFPRVKLCGGWLSPGTWDALELGPEEYPLGLWKWRRCHVQHGGHRYTVPGGGYFIRRSEFDDFLLKRSGAEVIQHTAQHVERRDGAWQIDGAFEARILIGAGGTHCPLARRAFRTPRAHLVAAQEHEFIAGSEAVAATRVGLDGEPELLLHEDWGGYSWNVPKSEWLNVGSGTSEPREVRAAWAKAREFFVSSGHVPESAASLLGDAHGHSYHLFTPEHLAACERDDVLLVGDALGLAHPLTGEGILPAVLSGKVAADCVRLGTSYRGELERHPVIRDYALARAALTLGIALRRRVSRGAPAPKPSGPARFVDAAAARGFARLFSGEPIPGSNLLGAALLLASSITHENFSQ